jgi:hypothetical protein
MKNQTWLRPCQLAKKYNVSLQLVNHWKKKHLDYKVDTNGVPFVKENNNFKLLRRG